MREGREGEERGIEFLRYSVNVQKNSLNKNFKN